MRLRHLSRLLTVLATTITLLLIASGAGAADDVDRWRERADPIFRHVEIPPALLVTQMAQDEEGFLWLGTQNGLVRWDGYRFLNHTAASDTSGSLVDSYITALHKDVRGRIWIGTSAGGLALLDAPRDRFQVLPAGQAGLSHVSVFAIADDPQGGLWIGNGAGLDHLAADDHTVRRHADEARRQGLPDGAVIAVLVDRAGGLWAGTRNGLFRRPPGRDGFERVGLGTLEGGAPPIACLMLDSQARVWVGTRGHGAFVIGSDGASVNPVRDTERIDTSGLLSDAVLDMLEIADGEVWLGTDGAGIVRVDTRTWKTSRVRHHDRAGTSLADDDVGPLFRDRSGLVWVGAGAGISAYDPTQRTVSTWFGYAANTGGVSHANVTSVLVMSDETAWLGLGDGGIDIVDPRRGRIAQLRPDASRPRSALPKGRVLAIARSPTGDIWIGTQLGLFRADGAGRRVVRVDVPGRSPTAATWAIHLDEDRLWIGGLDGLWGLRAPAHGSLQLFARRDAGSLADQRVTFLCRATGHAIWVGTRAGLAHFDPETGTVERMPLDAPGRVGMPGGYISSVLTDRRGRLWVASFGNGLRIVTPSKGGAAPIIHRVDSREGLPNNGINAMLLDSNDDVWLSTDDGLVRIRSDDLSITALRSAEGVGIPSYWTTSAAIAPSGAMLFGGSSGLTIVNPHRLPSWQFVAPLVVTKVNGETHAVAVPQASGARGGNPVPRLALADPQRRDLLVEFSALDYSAPEQNLYAHRLLGFDKDWIVTDSTQRLARYTNLPPGDYMLELRGSNRVGLWSQPLRWPVHVGAAWYETGWFRAAAIALAVTAILGLVQARTLVLRRRARELERLVADRTVELEQRSAELRESETQLAQMAYYDGLTGLANRRMFNDDIKRQLALSQRGQPFTLLLIDLDRFKQINDTQGHDAGDIVLTTVGERLRGAVRDIDQLARLGGDEFAVLLARSGDRVAVDAVCRRIVDSLGVPVPHKGGLLRTGASIGAAICPHDANNEVDLYKAADLALYAAKRAGGNGWCWSRHEAVTT